MISGLGVTILKIRAESLFKKKKQYWYIDRKIAPLSPCVPSLNALSFLVFSIHGYNKVFSPDQRDPASSEGLREWSGEDGHWTPHPGQGTCCREEIQQENRREGVKPELSEHG